MDKLKACPFCGSNMLRVRSGYQVECTCGAEGPRGKDGQAAKDAWNFRTYDFNELRDFFIPRPLTPEEVEKLRNLLAEVPPEPFVERDGKLEWRNEP